MVWTKSMSKILTYFFLHHKKDLEHLLIHKQLTWEITALNHLVTSFTWRLLNYILCCIEALQDWREIKPKLHNSLRNLRFILFLFMLSSLTKYRLCWTPICQRLSKVLATPKSISGAGNRAIRFLIWMILLKCFVTWLTLLNLKLLFPNMHKEKARLSCYSNRIALKIVKDNVFWDVNSLDALL